MTHPSGTTRTPLDSAASRKLAPTWTRGQRAAAVLGPAALVAVLAVSVLISAQRYREARGSVAHTRDVLATTRETLLDAQDAETRQRDYLLTGDSAYLAPYRAALADIGDDTVKLRALVRDNPAQLRQLEILSPLLRRRAAALDSATRLRGDGKGEAALELVRSGTGRRDMDSVRLHVRDIIASEEGLLATRQRAEERAARFGIIVVVVGALLAALLALLTNRLLAAASDRHAAHSRAIAEQADELEAANEQLHEQQVELERQAEQLQDQQLELETANEQLQDQATELEAQKTELEAQTEELIVANERLVTTNAQLSQSNEQLETSEARVQSLLEAERMARESAEDANRAKSQFLSTMSHELRTPLNGIAGHAQLIEMGLHGPVTDQQRNALERIIRAQQYLLSLINDVLNLSRIEAGKVEYDVREVSLLEVIADVAPMIEPQLAAKGMTLTVEGDALRDGRQPMVYADRDRLRQVLLNLLSNSAKFTPEGGQVSMVVSDDPVRADYLCVAVRDTGFGIPETQLASVFEPFVQVHRQSPGRESPSLHGTGLGLTISRDLMRGMGGEIGVESVVDQGSTFTITLRKVLRSEAAMIGG